MSIRYRHLSSARLGLAASLSLSAALIGCGGANEGTDRAVVTVNEPTSASSTAPAASATAPGAGSTAPAATKDAAVAPAAASPAASSGGWGTLKGRVVFSGDAPKPKVLVAKGDNSVKDGKELCAKQEIDSERLVVNEKDKGVRYAIVYIPKPTAVNKEAESAAKTAEVVFDQKNCVFTPHVLAAMQGATVTIKSSDSVGHNANSAGLNNNKFNLPTQPLSTMPLKLKGPDKPGLVKCDIHGWMEAYWLVLNNPYFAVTDASGNYEIKNVPAGEQKVVVWAEAVGPGYVSSPSGDPVAVKADGETTKDFTLDASKVK